MQSKAWWRMPEKKVRSSLAVAALIAAVGCALWYLPKPGPTSGDWPGVDEAVIGGFVERAGVAEPEPLFAWLQGDVLVFALPCAGLAAGFVLGYFARVAFVESDVRTRTLQRGERA